MIPIEETVAVLLCAGLSRRHPNGCKLMRELHGLPLVAHAANRLKSLPFRARLAVVPPSSANPQLHQLLSRLGFGLAENPGREEGQDSSIRAGIRAALDHSPLASLISLGDMPYVSARHFQAIAAVSAAAVPVASACGKRRSPPCLFPALFFPALLDGRAVPRDLVAARSARQVDAPASMLADFDAHEDFELADRGLGCSA